MLCRARMSFFCCRNVSRSSGGTQSFQINMRYISIGAILVSLTHEFGIMESTCITKCPGSIRTSSPFRRLSNITRVTFAWRSCPTSFSVFAFRLPRRAIDTRCTGRAFCADELHILFSRSLGLVFCRCILISKRIWIGH